MKELELIDMEKLEKAIVDLNEFVGTITVEDETIKEAITVIGKEKQDLVNDFTNKIEALPEDVKGDLPDPICDFYNDLYADEAVKTEEKKEPEHETRLEKAARKAKEKKAKADKEKKEAKPKKAREKKEPAGKADKKKRGAKPKEKDKFGFTIGGKASMFLKTIMEKPMKMSDVKALPWNGGRNTFYDAFNKLRRQGMADLDDQGRMYVKKDKIPA